MATTTMQNSTETKKGDVSKRAIKAKRKLQTRGSVKSKTKSVESLTTQIYRQGRDAVSGAYDTAAKASTRASQALPKLRRDLNLRARSQSVYTLVEERPLVLGALGLGVGMVLAALLPSLTRHRDHR